MNSSSPPSSRRTPADTQRLRVAHGSVRDTLGAIRNLEQLLKSIRVGPKDLAEVLPVSHDSLAPLRTSIEELLAGVQGQAPEAVNELKEYVFPRIDELDLALAKGMKGRINAKQRLNLEEVVTRSVRDLDAARFLWELLEEAAGGITAPVELAELARQTFQPSRGGAGAGARDVINLTLRSLEPVDVDVNARLATSLLAIAAELYTVSHPGRPVELEVGRPRTGVTVRDVTGEAGEELQLLARRIIPPTFACAAAAAAHVGGSLTHDARGHFSVSF